MAFHNRVSVSHPSPPELSSKRWRTLLLSPLLLLLLLPWCRREGATVVPTRDQSTGSAQELIESLVTKELGPPPYFIDDGKSLPGRPEVMLPIAKSVYKSVKLKFDGKPAGKEPFRFKAGQTVKIEGEIEGQPQLPASVGLTGGVGIVCKSDNDNGWMFLDCRFIGARTIQRHAKFEMNYTFPNRPGEYLLVIPSDATIGLPPIIPILIAGHFDLILE